MVVDDDAMSIKKLSDDLSLFPDVKLLKAVQSPE